MKTPGAGKDDNFFMKEALKEAQKAFEKEEVPIGAVIVSSGKIIARAHNLTELLTDCTAHAEMMAITAAQNHLNSRYLEDCSIYVTLEPCPMCAGALFWSQIGSVIYGASDPKHGYTLSKPNLLHPSTKVRKGVLDETSGKLITGFFRKKR